MSEQNSIQDTFFEECEDLLEALVEGLTEISEGLHDGETVNAVFRAVHSVKGGAGAFGLEDLVGFAHIFETVLDEIRDGKLEINPEVVGVLLRSSDHLADLVLEARKLKTIDPKETESAVTELEAYLDPSDASEEPLAFEPMILDVSTEPLDPGTEKYVIQFRPHNSLYKTGNDPFFIIQSISELGDTQIHFDDSEIPDFDSLDHNETYIGWKIELCTNRPENEIRSIFDFVEGLAEIHIERATEEINSQEQERAETCDSTPQTLPVTSITTAEKPTETRQKPKPTLRVDLDRVDRLINAVGELIINHSMLAQRISEMNLEDSRSVESELEDFKLLARNIQEGVMSIRAQPVKPLFQRMARITREAATATGKHVRLVTEGETTEVDKTVVERLSDPLTHIIRNAVDHGIESPEDRLENGKTETGEIRLSAQHRSGNVYIEVSDDGAGLNRPKIKDIATKKKLISESAELSDAEIDNLLFLPGFSTAEEVSNLSGRGVGMDVVKNAVTSLGGRISITSTPSAGTVFTIVLPLTLAVMDGMVVTVANETMVVPITCIIESLRASDETVHGLGSDNSLIAIRGNFVPVVNVAKCLGLSCDAKKQTVDPIFLLVELETSDRCALLVDSIHDQRQVVVKSLEGFCTGGPGISAATILGDGKIAMILDPDGIATQVNAQTSTVEDTRELKGSSHVN